MNSSNISKQQLQGDNNASPPSRFVKIIAGVATLGGLLFGYDTGVISGALLFMSKDLHLTPFTEGLVTSSLLFGAALGALISGGVANAAGRKRVIVYLAIIFIVGTLGTSFAPTIEWMIIFRFILGIAVGGAATTVPIYIAEIAPSEQRGRMVTIQDLMVVSGQLLAYASNAAFHQIWGGDTTWRWMLFVATLPAIALWFGMLFMPDTPRWYAMKGKLAEARKVLQKTRLPHDVDEELNEITSNLKEQANRGKASLKEILKTPWLSKLL